MSSKLTQKLHKILFGIERLVVRNKKRKSAEKGYPQILIDTFSQTSTNDSQEKTSYIMTNTFNIPNTYK